MTQGTVKFFSPQKGYGFINPDDGGEDVFVHHSVIRMPGYRTLSEGDRVEYEAEKGPKGFQATVVVPLDHDGHPKVYADDGPRDHR